jgi:hypothetical protein
MLLAGCETFKLGAPWPKQTIEVIQECKQLQVYKEQTVSMAELVDLIQQNYRLYHECKLNNDSWVKWYNTHWKKEK